MDGLTSQNMSVVDEELPGKALKKGGAGKQEEWKWMKDEMAVHSRYMRQQMKMIWTLPLRFFM